MAEPKLPPGTGVLPRQWIARAIDAGWVSAGRWNLDASDIQPASLDLRLGEVAYRVRCSFLPDTQTVVEKIAALAMDELDLRRGGAVLETNRPYLIPLKEALALPPGVRAKANPKSSTGRLDVFTRVITDRSYRFDEVAGGYRGPLYLEVVPLSFAVRVREDLSLNQLRLSVGHAELHDDEVVEAHKRQPLLYRGGVAVEPGELAVGNGLLLSLDLHGDAGGYVGYRARSHAPLLDMAARGLDPADYWDRVRREGANRVVLDPESFYLLMSSEAVSIAPTLASEMTAYDPTSGELRTHYAGFFDPGFGYDPARRFAGSRAALELRAHDVPFMVEHGQRVCKLTFERMLEEPDTLYGSDIGSSYQGQEETLGKHFLARGHPEPGPGRA